MPYDMFKKEQRVKVIATFDKAGHMLPLYVKIGIVVEKVLSATMLSEDRNAPFLEYVCISEEKDEYTGYAWKRTFNLLYFRDHYIWVLKSTN